MGPGCYTKELSVLCDAQVTVVIFSSTGKLNEFSNSRSGSCSILPSPDSRYSSTDWWLLGQNLWILVVFVTFRQLCDASLLCHGVSDEFPAGLWSFLMVSVVFDRNFVFSGDLCDIPSDLWTSPARSSRHWEPSGWFWRFRAS